MSRLTGKSQCEQLFIEKGVVGCGDCQPTVHQDEVTTFFLACLVKRSEEFNISRTSWQILFDGRL